MLEVNLEDFKAAFEQRRLWNKTPLKDIVFKYKGEVVKEMPTYIDDGIEKPLTIDDWRLWGLNNWDYFMLLLQTIDDEFNDQCNDTSNIDDD